MAAREGLPVVDFLSADNRSRGEITGRESSAFQPPVKTSPPSALSLRTRESSALALKHIFDQICSSAESKPNNNKSSIVSNSTHDKRENAELHTSNRGASNAAFQSTSNHVSPSGWQTSSILEEYKIGRADMGSSSAKVQPQVFTTNNSNCATPVLTPSLVQSSNLPFLQPGIPQAVSRPSASSPLLKQPTAQLTIFYSGTVNVYDDVPADKANAIMLLAGIGNSCSIKPANEGEKERAAAKLSSISPLVHMVAPPLTADAMASSVGITSAAPLPGKTLGFNLSSTPNTAPKTPANTIPTPSTPSSASSMPTEAKAQAVPPKRPHAAIELPQARKASLARFLEKRKDRVQVKLQEQEASPQGEGKGDRDERPPSPKKHCVMGLTSPTFKQY